MALSTKQKPKPATHHKKRQAQHHRKSQLYLKSYWPYLPMLLVVFLGIAINSFWSNHGVLGASSDFSAQTLLEKTNEQRQAASEPTLTIDEKLTAAAQAKASDMAARNYWSHDTPDGKAPWVFFQAAGYSYDLAGENLAYGFSGASEAVTGWMNSPGHRANILNAGYQNVGFGVVTSPSYQGKGEQTIVVAEYGKPSTHVANITFTVPSPGSTAGAEDVGVKPHEPATRLVSRIQLLSGDKGAWTTFATTLIASSALLVFLIRHGLFWRRIFVKGEVFITHHPVLDVTIVAIITAGVLLTRTTGLIR